MSQAGRKKPDKWRKLQRAAEQEVAAKRMQVAQLQEVNTALLCKQQAVEQIVDCLTAVQHIATQYNNSPDGGDSGQLLQLQQKLQFCLAQVGDTGQCATVKPHALDYLRVVWNPAWAAAVRAMSDEEVLQRVRQAMGKCALMVLQGQGAAAWEQQQPAVSGCSTDPFQPQPQPQPADQQCQPQQCQEAAQGVVRFSGHPVINQGLNAGQQGPPMSAHLGSRPQHTAGGAVGPSSSTVLQDSSAGAAGNSCSVCSGSIAGGFGRGPAFEVSAIWGVLFNKDEGRFLRLISLDLETGRELQLQHGPSFGLWLAHKLRLSAGQVSVLKGLRELVRQPHEMLPACIQEVSMQQAQLAQHQQQQAQWTSNMHAAGQVLDAHEKALQQQTAALNRFSVLATFMGLVTLNTLSPAQHATLHACSWPAISRIEPVLDVLDELQPYSG